MARTLTAVHSRKTPNVEAISFPVLTYTDAMPRDDLVSLNVSQHEHGKIGSWSFPRPGISDGNTNRNLRPGGDASFDFRLTAPPDEVLPSSARSDRSPVGPHIIGVALGSPSMLNSPGFTTSPKFNTSIFAQPQQDSTTAPRKGSKWKKIGGLFKAKNALANARPEQQAQSTVEDRPSTNNRKHEQRIEYTEEWLRVEAELKSTSKQTSSSHRSRNFSLSSRKPSKDTDDQKGIPLDIETRDAQTERHRKLSKDTNVQKSMHLDVKIPDVQMERYSLMFNNVMNSNHRPRPSLLARRAKTLDNLRVPDAEPFLAAQGLPVPRRRATSPAHANFTLFPTSQPPKAARILGAHDFPGGPAPLARANTVSVESPSKASLEASLEPPRLISNKNSTTSFESGFLPNLFTERSHTPRSSKSSIPNQDKPLPAIKYESQAQLKPQKLTPQAIRAVQSSHQDQWIVEKLHAAKNEIPVKARRSRPNLTIKTGTSEPPPLAKDEALELFESAPASQFTQELLNGEHGSSDPESHEKATSTDSDSNSQPSNSQPAPPEPIRISLLSESEEIAFEEHPESNPTIEVSTARSISVKRSKRQVLVPIGARVGHLSSNERFVDRRALTPTIMDVRCGHKYAVSQELQIESL